MKISLEEYNELQRVTNALEKKAERQKGARDEIIKQLQRDFGCSTIKEARTKLARMQDKEAVLNKEFETKLAALKAKWKHLSDE